MSYNSSDRSERLLQSRRFTTDNLILSQEAFTDVFDLGAGEIYTDDHLIPSASSQLPFSGSSQNALIVSASIVDPTLIGANDLPILRYYYRKKLKQAADGQREVYYFTTSDPSSINDTVTSDQLIESDQQTNFISPKYIVPADSVKSAEANPPGYKAIVYKDTSATAAGVTSNAITDDKYVFDYKTGVLTWNSGQQPASNQFVYMSIYQYAGRTLRSQIDDGTIGGGGSTADGFRIPSGSVTASVDVGNSSFLITSASLNLFEIERNGVAVFATQSAVLTTEAPNGGVFFTRTNFYVGLDNQ